MTHPVSLKNPGLLSFFAAQFLGAFNDNALKLVVTMASLTLVTDPAKQQGYIAMTAALAILPYILFSGFAGYLGDRYAKSTVLRISKAAEILAMLAVLIIFLTHQSLAYLLVGLFLLATHSAFFSPSKYGLLPEILTPANLPKANGYLNMLTFVAIIAGSIAGGTLWGSFKANPAIIGVILTGIAIMGTVLCLFVPTSPAGNARKKFSLNPIHELRGGFRLARQHRLLAACMFGSAMFWLLGGLIYLSVILLGKTQLGLSEAASSSLFAFLASGIAVGSVIAGLIIGKSIRLTVSVWGGLILSTGCFLTGLMATSYTITAALMALIGLGGGLFIVPIVTVMQKNTPEDRRGQLLATSSFCDSLGIFLASGAFWVLGTKLGLSASGTIMAAGGIALSGFLVAIIAAPKLLHQFAESAIYFVARRIYRLRLIGDGLEDGTLPQPETPTVFIANHVTFLDGLFISMVSRKPVRFLVLSTFWKKPLARFVLNRIGAIPFGTGNVTETRRGLEAARAALAKGEYICIFPEGILTRTGHLHEFKRGIEKLLEGTNAQVVPIYLERLWGSIFSFSGKRFFAKRPKSIPYPVTIAVGKPLPGTTPAWQLHNALAALGADAIPSRYHARETLGRRFLTTSKHHLFTLRMNDTTGQRLTSLRTLVGARLIARWLAPQIPEQNVALLIPASVGGALANIALALLGKTSVNLNFSLGKELMEQALVKAEVKHIITTHLVLKKLGLNAEDPRMLFLEDGLTRVSRFAKALALLEALLLPTSLLAWRWLRGTQRKDATATILFSSGSTAAPKAVMLAHQNLLANIDSVAELIAQAESEETKPYALAGTLPFFHAFGLTVCLWLPAVTGRRVAYHANPLEAKTVVKLLREEALAVLITTPTFARHYTAVSVDGALDALRFLILGGEKLMPALEEELQAALPKASILQGYGCTELGPVVAINTPDIKDGGLTHRGYCKDSVGLPIPGVALCVLDRENDTELAPGEEGRILVKSPACMQGYYHDEKLTEAAIQDGWYITGDIGIVDREGFLHITDRMARFSKIGGEMVPHGKVEEAIQSILEGDGSVAVIALADPSRGEKLYALTDSKKTPKEIHAALTAKGLPNLWIPALEAILPVEAIPELATGKRDLRAARALIEKMAVAA